MFSYVFMKILEGRPASYDRRIDRASGGRVEALKRDVAARVPPKARVLEIGCGTAELAVRLARRECHVDAFDRSRGMIAVARERVTRAGMLDRVRLRRMAVEGMDALPSSSYDAVVSTLVLSELSHDQQRFALAHAARVLVPGGRLIVADEVVPRTAGRRVLHQLVRAPALAATYLVTGETTQPIADLASEIRRAGFVVDEELRSHGDAFALVCAHRPREELAA